MNIDSLLFALDGRNFSREMVSWALALALGFPAVMLGLNELILRLRRRNKAITATLRVVRNLVMPTLAILMFLTRVGGVPMESTLVKIAQTAFWISMIHGALSLVNDVIFADPDEESWQANVPRLMIDVVRLILVLIGGAIVLGIVWGFDLTKWFAALGVGSVVIGLALQEPLGNVISGLMLMFERPIRVNDWVTADGVTGKVVEINWRSVRVETSTRELRIIPNSSLYKGSFSNLSRPNTMRTEMIELGFSYDDPPNKVKRILMGIVRATPGILDEPKPAVRTLRYDDFSIVYRVMFTVARQEEIPEARDTFMTRVWYATRRHGLTIPFPTQNQIRFEAEAIQAGRPDPAQWLASVPRFGVSDPAAASQIGQGVSISTFARGERIVAEGEPLEGLHLIQSGQVALLVRDRAGHEHEIARAGAGEFFGELSAVSGRSSEVTVDAVEDLEVMVLDAQAVQRWFDRSPRLVRELGTLMDARRRAVNAAKKLASIR